MDINIASFGIDLRSVSRVYFTNPVLNLQVEKQAIGRARRMGQKKQPIVVETLVLRDSVDEVVIERRGQLHTNNPSKRISLLDDQPTNKWIRNPRILPLPVVDAEPNPTLMAKLDSPYRLWPQDCVDPPLVSRVRDAPPSETIREEGDPPAKRPRFDLV